MVLVADCAVESVGLSNDGGAESNHTHWKIGSGGNIESVACEMMVLDLGMSVTSHSKTSPQQIALKKYSGEWYQEWSVVSDSVILMEAGGNATQTWSPRFVDPGYELALHPGFPGDMEIVDGESCLASTQDQYLGQSTMQSCDESMALLVGSKVSVGRLRAIADLIQEKGASRMPGYCCMDVATDSEFFGYNVSDANECNGSRSQFLSFDHLSRLSLELEHSSTQRRQMIAPMPL
jgi:hypothetical protein